MSNDLETARRTGGEKQAPAWLTTLAGLCLFLVMLLVVLVFGVRWFVLSRISPAKRAVIEKIRTEAVHFPAEWADVTRYPEELLKADDDLQVTWKSVSGRLVPEFGNRRRDGATSAVVAILKGEDPGEDALTSLTSAVEYGIPFLEETSRVVHMKGYVAGLERPGLNATDYRQMQTRVHLILGAALLKAQQEQWREALDFGLLAVRHGKRHSASTLITHLVTNASQIHAVEVLSWYARKCPDPDLLEDGLRELNALRPDVNPRVSDYGYLIDALGMLRNYRRAGYPVDLTPGKPAAHYHDQNMMALFTFQDWIMKQLPMGDPRRERYLSSSMRSGTPSRFGPVSSVLGLKLSRGLFPEMYYHLIANNNSSWVERERPAEIGYDLLRLYFAQRILELRGEPVPTRAADYCPRFLAEEPLDLYSGKSLLWSTSANCFYSVGQDRKDDGLAHRSEPFGEAKSSSGDLAIVPELESQPES